MERVNDQDLEFESLVKTPEESLILALDHTKEEIKDQVAHWRKELTQDRKDESDTLCYTNARLSFYLELLAFIAEKY